jgi:hypothetical protein
MACSHLCNQDNYYVDSRAMKQSNNPMLHRDIGISASIGIIWARPKNGVGVQQAETEGCSWSASVQRQARLAAQRHSSAGLAMITTKE